MNLIQLLFHYIMFRFIIFSLRIQQFKKKMISAVNGLANMGETCFLNTLLQALAACPQFCKWLELHKQSQLASALHEIITCK
jgi:ubiquitin C-terminal hydrolase